MKWTKQAPREPGWYWLRAMSEPTRSPEVVAVVVAPNTHRLAAYRGGHVSGNQPGFDLRTMASEAMSDMLWEWAGPIPEPSDE